MATIYLNSGDSVDVYSQSQIYGSSSVENVIIRPGALNVTLSPAVERAHFAGPSTDYLFAASGASLKVYNLDGDLVATLTAGAKPTLLFADGGIRVGADVNTGGVTLGGKGISTTPAPFAGTPDANLGQSLIGNESTNPSNPDGPSKPGTDDSDKDPSKPDDSGKEPGKDDGGSGTDDGGSGTDDGGSGTGDGGSGTGDGTDGGGSGTGTGTDDGGSGSGTGDGGSGGARYMVLQVGNLASSKVVGFTFFLNGKEYPVEFGDYSGADATYNGLVGRIKDAIDDDATLSGLDLGVALGNEFTTFAGRSGAAPLGTEIVLTSGQGNLAKGNVIFSRGSSASALYEAATYALPVAPTPGPASNYLVLEIIDAQGAVAARAAGTDEEHGALEHNPCTSFTFTVNGATKTVNIMDDAYSARADSTPTYAELAQKFRANIDVNPELKDLGLYVTLGDYFETEVPAGQPNAGVHVMGKQIVLYSTKGATLAPGDTHPKYGTDYPELAEINDGWRLPSKAADFTKMMTEEHPDHVLANMHVTDTLPPTVSPGKLPSLTHWLALDFVNHSGVVRARDEGTAPEYGALAKNPYTVVKLNIQDPDDPDNPAGKDLTFTFQYDSDVDLTPTYAELAEALQDAYDYAVNGDPSLPIPIPGNADLGKLGLKFELGERFSTTTHDGTGSVGSHNADAVNGTRILISSTSTKLNSITLETAGGSFTENGWYQASDNQSSFAKPVPDAAHQVDDEASGLKISLISQGGALKDNLCTGLKFTFSTGQLVLDDEGLPKIKGEVDEYLLNWGHFQGTGGQADYDNLVTRINNSIANDATLKDLGLVAKIGTETFPKSGATGTGKTIVLYSTKGELGEVALTYESNPTGKSWGDVSTNQSTYKPFEGSHAGIALNVVNPVEAHNSLGFGLLGDKVLDEQAGALHNNPYTVINVTKGDGSTASLVFGPYNGLDGTKPTYEALKALIETQAGTELVGAQVSLGNAFADLAEVIDEHGQATGTFRLGHGLQIVLSMSDASSMTGAAWGAPVNVETNNGTLVDMHTFLTDYLF